MAGSQHRLRRGLVVAGVLAIVVLLAAEVGARVLAPYLPEPKLWADDATTVKVAEMEARDAACTDVVVAGNSMGRDAFVPRVFQTADPDHRRAYNASLDAASPLLLDRWLNEEVVPRLHPSTVVLTLASLDVNANSRAGASVRDAYDDAPLTKAGAGGHLEAAAIRSSALLQHRTELRQPSTVWDAIGRARNGEKAPHASTDGLPGVIGADGEGLSRTTLHYGGNAASKAFLTSQLLNDYVVDDDLFRSEAHLLRALKEKGIDVAVVVLPVTDDYRALHPGGTQQFDDFLAGARRLSDDTSVPLIDLHAGTDPTQFADTHHLNGSGADELTRRLPELLAQHGLAPRHCA